MPALTQPGASACILACDVGGRWSSESPTCRSAAILGRLRAWCAPAPLQSAATAEPLPLVVPVESPVEALQSPVLGDVLGDMLPPPLGRIWGEPVAHVGGTCWVDGNNREDFFSTACRRMTTTLAVDVVCLAQPADPTVAIQRPRHLSISLSSGKNLHV